MTDLYKFLDTEVQSLKEVHRTSMSIWAAYWNARVALRQIAIEAYQRGLSKQEFETSMEMVEEGMTEISSDFNDSMVAVCGNYDGSMGVL